MIVNWHFTDRDETLALTLRHCTLSHRLGEWSDMANASVTTTRAVLDSIVLGKRAMQDAVKEGLIKTEGDPTRLAVLFAALNQPANLMFDILTPGEGRMIYCMQAHEDKISIKCAFELGEAATSVQTAADALKDAVIACKAEINGVCGKILPGQGRIAACLLSNKSTASAGCTEAIQKIESIAAQ